MANKADYAPHSAAMDKPYGAQDQPDMAMDEYYMTVNEFCERMRISASTAYRMIKNSQIPAFKFGRRYKIPRSVFHKLNPRFF